MTAQARSLTADETKVADALTELREARTIHDHSPTADSEHAVTLAERRLNILLDRLPRPTAQR